MVHANLLARIGRVFTPSVPVICTVHSIIEGQGGPGADSQSRLRELAYRLTDPLASATTAVSEAATRRYVQVRAVPAGRIATVPNGYDFARVHDAPGDRESIRRELAVGDRFLWVTMGRLVPEKGHDLLLHALHGVRRTRPEVRLLIGGEGPERQRLEHLIADLDLGPSVSLLGFRRDVSSILLASDAFVLSSRVEGLPMALIEAAAHRLPIVSTDVGGCREVAIPELGAILTERDADSMSSAMLRVMDLPPEERARIGQDLRDHAHSAFELAAVVDRWEALYASAIGTRRGGTKRRPGGRAG
jgi:glycosyltransferase involved in cell wall biosynthesis